MSDSRNHRQSVLMRSSLRLHEKDDLCRLITAEIHAELPGSAIRLRIYPTTHKTKKTRMILCEALGSWPAPTEVVSVLRTIANGSFPASSIEKLQQKVTKYRSPKLSMSMEEMPDTFRSFCRQAGITLSRAIQRFVGVLRWRIGILNAFPLWAYGSEFSADGGVVWHWLPHDISGKVQIGEGLPTALSSAVVEDAKKLIAEGKEDSSSRQLFREAWALRLSNPRAALTVGYASLEVGCKELIGKLVPEAKWLAMEAPTPSLDKMLTHFLPQLPKKLNFKGGPAIPPPLLKHVREAMKARNTLAHKGEFDWNDEKLEAVLGSFNDLLLMFDVYAGQRWASELVSYETLKLLRWT
jgi:hypothetical protein